MQIDLDLSDLQRWADDLTEVAEQIPAAISRAVNRTGDMVRTAMGRELASETGMGVREVRAEFIVSRASADEPVYEITVPSHTTTLAHYDPRQTNKGVSARPWATRRIFPHTFMVRDEVFRRVGKERYPIVPLFGPNLAHEAAKGPVEDVVRSTAEAVFPERLRHELERLVGHELPGGDDEGDSEP